ncbi:MAG: (2Fe-2S) ferredoxin domain-containing protein [Oscillatoriophycideae cyanobacterium NC_groundwater_1537_Pr4_S-0.65um_50_18]|nr:(2Fe-2S) ferredoxin domain-containing protein [Oscillatoriophycideae cyanobacterium NC_groundwater_1537_Pr4_S-0.65um_50_18]
MQLQSSDRYADRHRDSHSRDHSPEFQLEGRFLGFAAEEGSYKLKYLRIATATGELQIKLAKELRSSLLRELTPGEWIQVRGYQKLKAEQGTVKLKAYEVTVAVSQETLKEAPLPSNLYPMTQFEIAPVGSKLSNSKPPASKPSTTPQIAAPTACILMCQKSDCCKRGSREVAKALQAELSDRGLAQVTVKATGCMKRCKEGANVVMPDKTRYTRVRPEEVSALVDRHFSETLVAIESKSA